MSRPIRRILLVDCDMFFVQVARLSDPEVAGRAPLLMVGGSATGRGVVTSADYRVREFGVRSGMPMARALELCPEATVAPVPREACSERSRLVRSELERLAPVVQAASIDEFYLDLTGTERLFEGESLADTARRIRDRVLDASRISVSVGGGTTRLVAKLAVERAKPAGVHIVAPGEEEVFMRTHELGAIPGIGPVLLARLHEKGLKTVPDVLEVEDAWLARWFGASRAQWLRVRVRGIDDSPVEAGEARKSISSERTFARDISGDEELGGHLHRAVLEVGGTLRAKGFRARTVTVRLRDGDFTTRQASRTLSLPVESDRAIYRVARELLAELRSRRRAPARLLGVGVSGLEGAEAPVQLALMDSGTTHESERDRSLARASDDLRSRFGKRAVLPGTMLDSGNTSTEPMDDEDT